MRVSNYPGKMMQCAYLLAVELVLHHEALLHRHLVLEGHEAEAPRPSVWLAQNLLDSRTGA